jgi:hypothetical protein
VPQAPHDPGDRVCTRTGFYAGIRLKARNPLIVSERPNRQRLCRVPPTRAVGRCDNDKPTSACGYERFDILSATSPVKHHNERATDARQLRAESGADITTGVNFDTHLCCEILDSGFEQFR